MVPSARRGLVVPALALTLAGCTTTQHEAARVRLDSARQRAALAPTRVTVANRLVTADAVAAIRAHGVTAFVVRVRNRSRRAVTDLPISVGYRRMNGRSVYLNRGAALSYFEAHLPAIAPGRTLVWVYTAHRAVPAGAQPFARVGLRPAAPARLSETDVRIGLSHGPVTANGRLAVELDNATSVPQYQLQVYAYAERGGQYVAGGDATVADLGAGARRRLQLSLVGAPSDRVHIEAVPTILQ